MAEKMMTLQDIADETGLSVRTLYNQRTRGEGPRGYTIGNRLRFRRADVDAWLAQHVDTPSVFPGGDAA